MTSSGAHGYLVHLRAEIGPNARPAKDRLGQYDSAAHAERALERGRGRHAVCKTGDARWEGEVA